MQTPECRIGLPFVQSTPFTDTDNKQRGRNFVHVELRRTFEPFAQTLSEGRSPDDALAFRHQAIVLGQVLQISHVNTVGDRRCAEVDPARRKRFQGVVAGATEADDSYSLRIDAALSFELANRGLISLDLAMAFFRVAADRASPRLQDEKTGSSELSGGKTRRVDATGHKLIC